MKGGRDEEKREGRGLEGVSAELRAHEVKYTGLKISLHQQKVNFFRISTKMTTAGSDKFVGGRQGSDFSKGHIS